jgi:hypothetical protein
MYGVSYRAPWSEPNGAVTCMNLVDRVGAGILFNLQNRGPKNGLRASGIGCLEGAIVVIFSLEDRGEKRIFVSHYIPSSLGEKTFVDSMAYSR